MTKQVSSLNSVANAPGVFRPFAVALLGLGMASFVFAPQSVLGAHPPTTPAQEESVLIATREAPGTETNAGKIVAVDALEPIAQSSDRNPELAGGSEANEDAGSRFGEALAKIATPPKHEKAAKSTETTRQSDATSADASGPSGAARRAAAARADAVTFEAVKFQGIAVGKSTKHELITAWSAPADSSATPEGEVLLYRKSPFQAVEVLVSKNGLVSTIKITLAAPIEYKKLSEQLSLDKIDPVTITDDADKGVGLAFPERGVMFMYTTAQSMAPTDDKSEAAPITVSHVVIQQLDSHAFALRAE